MFVRYALNLFAIGSVLTLGLSAQVPSSFPIYSISTFAGAPPVSSPEGTAATGMLLGSPRGLALDKTGNLYIADAGFRQVFMIAPNGTWHVFAGSGDSNTPVQDGQRAVSAPLNHPVGVAVDPAGSVYVADGGGEGESFGLGSGYVYKVTPDGVLHFVAGNGTSTYSGDGGPAKAAGVWPSGIAPDGNGNLYIAEYWHDRIRRVDPSGIITTIGGNGSGGQAISGDFVATNSYMTPNAVAASSSGDVYYVQTYIMSVVRKITADGKIHDLSDSGNRVGGGHAVAVDQAGTVYGGVAGGIYRISPAGLASWVVRPLSAAYAKPTIFAEIGSIQGLAVGAGGDEIYFSDTDLHAVWKAKLSAGTVTRVAGVSLINFGDGGPAAKAVISTPDGVAVDGSTIYISNLFSHNVRKVAPDGTITTVAGVGLPGYSGDGGPGTSARLNYPAGLAVDGEGSLYIADSGNNRVRKLSRSGIITTVAGDGSYGPYASGGDGNKATAAQIGPVVAVAFDKAGSLYLANFATVRKVDTGGIISTVPGTEAVRTPTPTSQLPWIGAMAVDPSGTVYIAEQHTYLVKRLHPDGSSTVVAGTGVNGFAGDGGAAAKATIGEPHSLALDGQGSLYLAEYGPLGSGVRKISPDGTINVIAGYGMLGGTAADGGPATAASLFLYGIYGLAVDSSGNVYVPETSRASVRKLTPLAVQRLELKGGDGQSALPTTQSAPLQVRVLATGGIPVPLVPVLFAVTGGSATIASADVTTGADGTANCTIATGDLPGPVTVTATALNLTPVVFHLTARPWATVNSGGVVNAAGNLPLLAPGSLASIYGSNYGVIFNNLNGTQPVRPYEVGLYPGKTDIYSVGFNFVVPAGNDFVFTAGAYYADWVACCPPDSSNSVTLALYSDSGGSPGSVLDSFNANIPANSYAFVPFRSVANPSLLSGRQYWLVASMTNPSTSYSQWLTQNPPDPGRLAWTLDGGPWQISDVSRGGFQILGSPVAKASTVPLPASLAGVSVTVGGRVAPISYVGPAQINFQVPYDLTPGTYPLVVTANGTASDPVDVTVAATAPGVFVYGNNWAVIQNQDYKVNAPSSPAQAGSYVTLYGTGAGVVSPAVATGSAAPNSPLSFVAADVTASINGVPATVSFAGLTPGNVGLLQVNLQVPALQAGTYPIQITVGGVTSNTASIAVAQ